MGALYTLNGLVNGSTGSPMFYYLKKKKKALALGMASQPPPAPQETALMKWRPLNPTNHGFRDFERVPDGNETNNLLSLKCQMF